MPAHADKFRTPITSLHSEKKGSATLDFGSGEYQASVTITGLTWIRNDSTVLASIAAVNSTDHRREDAVMEGITCYVGNIIEGVGCTIYANAPLGTFGTYTVCWLGA